MKVRVNAFGQMRELFPGRQAQVELELPAPVSLRDIICELGINPLIVMMCTVDGQYRDKEFVPEDGAEIVLIAPPAGG